ncbi:MAG: hypothetical protein IPH28_25280 [Cytophagaceae bacterium]|nr:hypothetical protein [Cytophagaceae bacterium]
MLRGNVEEPGGTGRSMYNYSELFRNGGQVAAKAKPEPPPITPMPGM